MNDYIANTDTDTNTHYTTHGYVGATSTATANATATNGNVYLNICDDSTVRNAINIKGSGATTVTCNNSGVITINSVDTNTDTDTHYTTHGYVTNSSTGTAAAATTTNNNVYLNIADNTTIRDAINIRGAGATTVTCSASKQIYITSTNTTYSVATTAANGLMSSTDKTKLNGISGGVYLGSGTPGDNDFLQIIP